MSEETNKGIGEIREERFLPLRVFYKIILYLFNELSILHLICFIQNK